MGSTLLPAPHRGSQWGSTRPSVHPSVCPSICPPSTLPLPPPSARHDPSGLPPFPGEPLAPRRSGSVEREVRASPSCPGPAASSGAPPRGGLCAPFARLLRGGSLRVRHAERSAPGPSPAAARGAGSWAAAPGAAAAPMPRGRPPPPGTRQVCGELFRRGCGHREAQPGTVGSPPAPGLPPGGREGPRRGCSNRSAPAAGLAEGAGCLRSPQREALGSRRGPSRLLPAFCRLREPPRPAGCCAGDAPPAPPRLPLAPAEPGGGTARCGGCRLRFPRPGLI